MRLKSKKGFITVATGNYYCRLAINLLTSYRMFSNTDIPMYVMTDKNGEKLLKKHFDGVIVMDKPTYTTVDKMEVYFKTPFEETIFLDADMSITRDIRFMFNEFQRNGSPISCIGSYRSFEEWGEPIHFGQAAVEKYHLTGYLAFGGGVYYYRKGPEADNVFQFIFDELIPNYHQLDLHLFRTSQMADEPLMDVAMLVYGMNPLESKIDIMRFISRMMDTLSWDLEKKECHFTLRDGSVVSPAIVHYGTDNTYHKKYVYYNAIIRCKYRHLSALIPFAVCFDETVLLFRHIGTKSDRKAFYKWFKEHFTAEYWRHTGQKIKALFKK